MSISHFYCLISAYRLIRIANQQMKISFLDFLFSLQLSRLASQQDQQPSVLLLFKTHLPLIYLQTQHYYP